MTGPARVLLVEDNPGDADLIRLMLAEDSGDFFAVTDVPRLADAARAAKRERYDVVLLDLGLPDSAGLDTLRAMRAEASDVPIVVVTGNTQAQVGLDAIKAGAQDFVVKGQVTGAYLGKVLSFACERHDISRRLQESEEQLHQSQKMEALGRLAGGIAHDFNNLLTAILGYSDLLMQLPELSGPLATQGLAEIKHAAQRAASLTHQVLSFSRRQTMQTRVVSLNEVLTGMEALLRRTVGEHIDLVIVPSPDGCMVDIDPHLFEQVLLNLVVNARDAMSPGGRLTIETGETKIDQAHCDLHPESTPGMYATLKVSDTGCGMSEGVLAHIFEPFYTTKPVGQGTGLGLATVYGIVRQSGGSILVTSEVGKGTCFEIHLPRVVKASHQEAPCDEVTEKPAGGDETVLVVEDESALRQLVFTVLTDLGYRVQCAGSAEEAFQVLSDSSLRFDLLVTDLVLPGVVQGHDVAHGFQRVLPGLPVLYMSGYARSGVVHEGHSDKAILLLEKPFTLYALATAVRRALDQAKPVG